MPLQMFFSWQSDTPNSVGRSFVETCLERAIAALVADAEVELADRDVKLDKDTKNVPGSPSIAETIFAKIDYAAVFLGDLTYVATRIDGTRSPNPNVLVEQGYALKSRTSRRVIAVMNTAFGDPKEEPLPFDLRYARWPIQYRLTEEDGAEARKAAKAELIKDLTAALKSIFEDKQVQEALKPPAPAEAHPRDIRLVRRFRKLISTGSRQFLRDHNFGATLHRSKIDPFYDMWAEWRGAESEFHDTEVQKAFAEVLSRNADFAELANTSLHMFRNNENALTIKTDVDMAQGTQPSTVAAAKALNEKATALSASIDRFERVSRDRLRAADEDEKPDEEQLGKAAEAVQQLALAGNMGAYPEIVPRPRLSLRVAPLAATTGRRLDTRVANAVQSQFRYRDDQVVKEDADGNQWWVCAPPTPKPNLNPETAWRMRLVRPGNFEFQCNLGERIEDDPHIIVDGIELEKIVINNLERMFGFADELGFDGSAVISIGFEGMEDVEFRQGRRKIRRSDIGFDLISVTDMAEPVAPAVQELLDALWQMAGQRDGSPSFRDGRWTGYGSR